MARISAALKCPGRGIILYKKFMGIEQEILSWDGTSSDDLVAIYNRYKDDCIFVSQTVKLLKQDSTQQGALWLLKRYFENGGEIGCEQVAVIYKLLPLINQWQTKLLILQCMRYMKIGINEQKLVENFLRSCLNDNNKFLRAWAYNGFYEISTQFPEYKQETKQFFEMAMRDEVPSVKARIRNIVKNGF